jgi:hypothetical protein
VEDTRVGQITDYDKLTLEIWTNGTLKPEEAISSAAKILNEHLNLFISLTDQVMPVSMVQPEDDKKDKVLETIKKKGTYVWLIRADVNEANESWCHVQYKGKDGYIMTKYLDLLTQEDSDAYNNEQASPAPVITLEELFPTEVPTEVVTLEVTEEPTVEPTDTPEPTATPTEEPTATPTEKPTEEPTEEPTATPTEAPTATPTEKPTEAPTETPTQAPTQEPTATPVPEPTQQPYQRVGYAITIGDGVYVRQWPTYSSAFVDELPANKIVYVTGQAYVDNIGWSMAEYDNKWGYVRADMLRMISDGEMQAYRDLIQGTPDPSVVNTVEPYQYNAQDESCYGYVTQDKVNFRTAADKTSGKVIRKLNKNALCLVYGSEQSNGETWYRVGYEADVGYVNGQYFKQMTVGEAERFLNSSLYTEGLNNNSASGSSTSSETTTTGTASGIVSAEDQKVSEWVNPSSGSTVSYEPFDPFATPSPLEENGIANSEYLDSLASKLQDGTLKQEDLQTELEKFYKDAADPEGSVTAATAYILEKTGLTTETPSESPEPMVTEEIIENPQEKGTGGGIGGWLIGLGLLAAAGGGGYYWYASTQKKRQAAQRIAQKKAAEQRKTQGSSRSGQTTNKQGQPATAQNAARVRTGNYSSRGNTTTAKPSQTDTTARKAYGSNVENPYGRYSATSSTEEDATYTASFKPETETDKPSRIRRNATEAKPAEKTELPDDPKA